MAENPLPARTFCGSFAGNPAPGRDSYPHMLTVLQIKSARAPGRLTDGGGLVLWLRENGRHWWRLRYRYAGKENMISLGVWPDVGLAEARQRREEARRLLARGIDPAALSPRCTNSTCARVGAIR